eukprot:CCRYP_005499-RB/>CCRYP_005499-RB protein AED:0.03 eAED:0.03 QI:288/1/1/1/1/1/4/386/1180
MIRACLSSSRDRRCMRLTPCSRWIQHRDSGLACLRTSEIHVLSSPSASHTASFSRHCSSSSNELPTIRRVPRSYIRHGFHPSTSRPNSLAIGPLIPYRNLSSSMRPKPLYDFSEQENEEDDTINAPDRHSDADLQLDWIERSPSMDNFSKYDNYSQYSSSSGELKPTPNEFNPGEGSLLDLLSQVDRRSTHDEDFNSMNQNHQEDGSLLQLLSRTEENGPSGSLLELLNNEDYKSRPSSAFTHNEEDDLRHYLNDSFRHDIDESSDRYDHSPKEEIYDEAPLIELLKEESSTHSKYKDLQRTQLQLEIESSEEAIAKSLSVWKSARDRSDHGTIPVIRKELTAWYASLTAAIELEQWMYLNGDYRSLTSNHLPGNANRIDTDSSGDVPNDKSNASNRGTAKKNVARDRTIYGPLLCLLPPQKIAILLAHTALSSTIADGELGTKVVSLAVQIAQTLETEINVSRALRVRASKQRLKMLNFGDDVDEADNEPKFVPKVGDDNAQESDDLGEHIDKWVYTATHLQRFLDEISNTKSGSPDSNLPKGKGRVRPALVRKRCQEILHAEGFMQTNGSSSASANQRPLSMNDFAEWDPVVKVKLGAALIQLLLDHTTYSKSFNPETGEPNPAFLHSRKKLNADMRFHGFISIHPELYHTAMKAELSPDSMFFSQRFMQNTRCQPMVVPPKDWVNVNDGGYEIIKVDFMRTRQCKTQKDAIRNADLSKVYEGLNVLGRIPWKVNKNVLDAARRCWDEGVVLGDIPPQTDYEVPPLPERVEYCDLASLSEEEKEMQLKALKSYKDGVTKHFRFKQKNMDLHSLRCSAMLKLNQAKKFQDFGEIFFPYNVDFRGRAYPVPPHLSIVGSDLCRALLMFAHPKPLGPNGLYWLKVHLANLAGANKMSFDGRAQFADDNMDNIRAAVNDPFGGNNWWMSFDDPFQGLATCHEIVKAIDSGDHENYMCSLPVHMDGSCNGLQHYAALGRDKVGGKAVNLCIADNPQDVYSGVMHEVIRRVALDAEEQLPFDENKSDLSKAEKDALKRVKSARLVNGLIDRGVVKRTVMTSVYGVTYIGAKNQISEKIEEKLEERGHDIDELEAEIHTACGYLASLTMEVMGQLFTGARQTMNWLTACARLIAAQGQPVAFVSPIGVPVVQPYRQKRPVTVVTLLQNVVLTYDSDLLPCIASVK